MTEAQLYQALHAILGAASLAGIAWLYCSYRFDRLRDQLFGLRDEMFDYAAANGLLAHPGYRQVRQVFNGMLRFCHRMTFMRLMLAIWLDGRLRAAGSMREPVAEWLAQIADLPTEQRQRLIDYHLRMLTITMKFLILGSPIGWVLIASHRIRAAMVRGIDSLSPSLVRRWSGGLQLIERQALET